jgi:hypothetical protein
MNEQIELIPTEDLDEKTIAEHGPPLRPGKSLGYFLAPPNASLSFPIFASFLYVRLIALESLGFSAGNTVEDILLMMESEDPSIGSGRWREAIEWLEEENAITIHPGDKIEIHEEEDWKKSPAQRRAKRRIERGANEA